MSLPCHCAWAPSVTRTCPWARLPRPGLCLAGPSCITPLTWQFRPFIWRGKISLSRLSPPIFAGSGLCSLAWTNVALCLVCVKIVLCACHLDCVTFLFAFRCQRFSCLYSIGPKLFIFSFKDLKSLRVFSVHYLPLVSPCY